MITRRALLGSAAALALVGPARAAGGAKFDPADIVARAEAMAQRAYRPRPTIPEDWRNLSYELYKSIWFRPPDALWQDEDRPYAVDFFHPGLYFPRGLTIHEVRDGMDMAVPFDLSKFDKTDKVPDLTIDDTLGYSGFRLRTELSEPGIRNEFCVFQGASYFRAIGAGQIYGLSARGLAIGTASPQGEEFPDFTEFWLETPKPGEKHITVHALLDSPSVTGAYRFVILPGETCEMDVTATLFPRKRLNNVGLGPLTSMFFFDGTNRHRFEDFRPAVHDNDGLMIVNGMGEHLWRPLANPKTLQISSFSDRNPRGFGLMQRSRKFSDFADLQAHYHKRPGLWVEPQGDWGQGSVVLVEIPTDREIYDNIVAYWRPTEDLQPGERYDFQYRLTWCNDPPPALELPRVTDTLLGKHNESDAYVVKIDYVADPMHADPEALTIHLHSNQMEIGPGRLERNPETGGLRLGFDFDPGDLPLVEIRAQLRLDGKMASEVWLYRWTA